MKPSSSSAGPPQPGRTALSLKLNRNGLLKMQNPKCSPFFGNYIQCLMQENIICKCLACTPWLAEDLTREQTASPGKAPASALSKLAGSPSHTAKQVKPKWLSQVASPQGTNYFTPCGVKIHSSDNEKLNLLGLTSSCSS